MGLTSLTLNTIYLCIQKLSKISVVALLVAVVVACSAPDAENSEVMHLDRAKVYRQQGQYRAAVIEYKNALKKSGGDAETTTLFADLLNQLGQHGTALELLEKMQAPKDERYYLELTETLLGMKKYYSAAAILKEQLGTDSRAVKLLRAELHLGLNELNQAGQLYQQLLATNAEDDEAALGQASVLAKQGQVDESLQALSRIKLGSEAYVQAQILVANLQIAKEQLESAESTLSGLLSRLPNTDIIEPQKVAVLGRLSYVLTRQGRSNEAYIYTKLLAEAFPGASEVNEQYNDAVQKFQAGDLDAAKAILSEILKQFPSHNKAIQLMGIISYLRGDNDEASKYLAKSVDPENADPIATHIYAATNLKLNDAKKVLEILEPGIERVKIPATLALYGLAAISDQQYAKGEAALLRALELAPNDVRIRLALAGFYRVKPEPDKGKEWQQLQLAYKAAPTDLQVLKDMVSYRVRNEGSDSAGKFIEQVLAAHPKDYASNLIAGHYAVSRNELKQALANFTTASKVETQGENYLAALFARGKTELALKQVDQAESSFNELVRVFPGSESGYRGLFSVYAAKSGIKDAQQRLEQLAPTTSQVAPYLVLIQSAVAQNDIAAAKRYHAKALELRKDDREIVNLGNAIQYVEATAALKKQEFDRARDLIAPLLVSEPDNLRVLSFLVDLEIQTGQLNEAAKVVKQIEEINQDHPVVLLLKGDLALANKNFEEAKDHFSAAWKNNSAEVAADKLFKVLGSLKDEAGQQEHLNSWLKKFPESNIANLYQANLFQHHGQRAEAIKSYEKVLTLTPNSVLALNNLGWLYFEIGDDRALSLLKTAQQLAPENPAVLDSYGWVLVNKGKVAEGLVYLEQANKLAPEMQEIADHLNAAKTATKK